MIRDLQIARFVISWNKGDKMKPTKQEIDDCIKYFKSKGTYAYENDGCVYLDFDNEYGGLSVEISSDEIIARAELYNEENQKGA